MFCTLEWQGSVQVCGATLRELLTQICEGRVHVRDSYPTGK